MIQLTTVFEEKMNILSKLDVVYQSPRMDRSATEVQKVLKTRLARAIEIVNGR